MTYRSDDFLYNLNKPMLMAGTDDLEDEAIDDDDIDLDSDDDLDDDDLPSDQGSTSKSESSESKEPSARQSTGIIRSALGFGSLVFAGIIPLVLMILYLIKGAGLSLTAILFLFAFFVGFILSVWTFIYYNSGKSQYFTKFELRSFFKASEIAVIAVVLLAIAFLNLGNLYSGKALRLSSESTLKVNPNPVFAPKPPQEFEEEVLYTSPEFADKEKANVQQPKKDTTVNKTVKPQVRVAPPPKRAMRATTPKKENIDTKKEDLNNTTLDKENTSITKTSTNSSNSALDQAVNISEMSIFGYLSKGSESTSIKLPTEVQTSPLVSSLFLGGVLCAALGYAFPLAIAGLIFGLFRRFNHPFAAQVRELINEETGEITFEVQQQNIVNKILDIVFRMFIGFNIGGTIGFFLGILITLPLYFIFWTKAQTDPMILNFIMSLGVVKNPDLAYSTGLIVSAIVVPIVIFIVGKASPAGKSITEEEVRKVYSIPITITKIEQEPSSIPEPAIISFDLDDSGDRESDEGIIVDDFEKDMKDSLTSELFSEFGMELEKTFGFGSKLPVKSSGDKALSEYEKQKVAQALDRSLGELGNVTVKVSAELGKATMFLTDWLNLSEGMLVELEKPVNEEIDILINDVRKGKGKLTIVDNHLGVEISKSNFGELIKSSN